MNKAKTKNGKNVAQIMIVDDHPLVRHGLIQLISCEPDLNVCAEAGGAAEALKLVEQHKPDLVIVDISLNDGSGIDLVKQIKASYDEVKTIVLSMHDEALFAERVLHAGAMGYVNKQEATEKAVTAIRQVLKGKIYVNDKLADRILFNFAGRETKGAHAPFETLSNRELEIFELIGEGLSTRQIAQKLHLSVKTIETYRENIKRKLNLSTHLELIRSAMHWMMDKGGVSKE